MQKRVEPKKIKALGQTAFSALPQCPPRLRAHLTPALSPSLHLPTFGFVALSRFLLQSDN